MDVMQESHKRVQHEMVFGGYLLLKRMSASIWPRPDKQAIEAREKGPAIIRNGNPSLNKAQFGSSRRCEIPAYSFFLFTRSLCIL
jgi:hypothetical protein